MKKCSLALLCLTAFFFALPAGTITLTAPVSGVTISKFGTITWSYTGIPDTATVKIMLFKDGVFQMILASGVKISDRARVFGEFGQPGGAGYQVRVQTEDGSGVMAMSGTFFYYDGSWHGINPPGGDWLGGIQSNQLVLNSTFAITWLGPWKNVSTTRIELWRNNAKVGVIAEGAFDNFEGYKWTVGKLQSGSAPAGNGYYVIICLHPATGGELVSPNWGTFQILDKSVVVLLKKSTSSKSSLLETQIGEERAITWFPAGSGSLGPAKVELWQHGQMVCPIVTCTKCVAEYGEGGASGQSYIWPAGKRADGGWVKAGDGYRIRVSYPSQGPDFWGESTLFSLRGMMPIPPGVRIIKAVKK